jgi:4-amino-4-deoxy-L-arabinose transferase-like glycosyltransferase
MMKDGFRPQSLLILFLLALLPRLPLAFLYRNAPIALDDMFQYDMLARSLSEGKGYRWYQRQDVELLRPYLERYYGIDLPMEDVPEDGFVTTFRAPGYPFFLAALYALTPSEQHIPAARFLQTFLGAALAPLAAVLALRLGLRRKAAWWAGVVIAFYPILWMYPLGLASENLFIPLVALSMWALLVAAEKRTWYGAIAAGLALGAATLTRGALALFLPLAALWLWKRAGFRQTALLTVATSALLVPWMVRNSLILGKVSFVENSMGYNLFVGYHPQGNGGFVSEVAVIPLDILDDGERDLWTRQQALEFMRQDPARAAGLAVQRLDYFWGLEDRELTFFYSNNFFGPIPQPWLALGYIFLVTPFLAAAFCAPWGMALSPGPGRTLALLLILASMAAYVPILAEPRFHLSLVPLLAAYAAAAWTTPGLSAQLWRGLRSHELRWWLAAAACLALLVLWGWDVLRSLPTLRALMAPGGNLLGLSY